MLIQLEDHTVINIDNVILQPVVGEADNQVNGYKVMTSQDLRYITDISPREFHVILILAAFPPENKEQYPIRTPDWGFVGDRLNYRYAKRLSDLVDGGYGSAGLMTWLKAQLLQKATSEDATIEDQVNLLHTLLNLAKDREFNEVTEKGRKTLFSLCNRSVAPARQRLASILDDWDDIFVDLPF